jgi:hypothetical protein
LLAALTAAEATRLRWESQALRHAWEPTAALPQTAPLESQGTLRQHVSGGWLGGKKPGDDSRRVTVERSSLEMHHPDSLL